MLRLCIKGELIEKRRIYWQIGEEKGDIQYNKNCANQSEDTMRQMEYQVFFFSLK